MNAMTGILRSATLALAVLGLATSHVSAQPAPIKIGVVLGFTGLSAVLGAQVNDAIAAFTQEHGDTIAGRKVVIVRRDTGGPIPDAAARVTQDLIVNEKVDLIIGPEYSPSTAAITRISTEAKKPVFVITATQNGIVDNAPYMVLFGFSQRQYEAPYARWAAKNGIHNLFMLYANFTAGIDAVNTFREIYTGAGGNVVGDVGFPLNATEFSAYAQRVKDAKPDALWLFLVPGVQPGLILKALHDVGVVGPGSKMKILDNGGITDEPNLDGMGDSALGVISSFIYSDAHPSRVNRDFVDRFEKIDPKNRPDFIGAIAYDCMTAAYKVLAAQNGVIDPDKTMALVKGMKFEGPRGPVEIDPATRTATQNVYIRRVERRGGHLVNVEFETTPMLKT